MATGLMALSQALALRLRDLTRLADRLDRLESGSGACGAEGPTTTSEAAGLGFTADGVGVSGEWLDVADWRAACAAASRTRSDPLSK